MDVSQIMYSPEAKVLAYIFCLAVVGIYLEIRKSFTITR